jgi:4-hydroxy-4-methyl-2-oxoglutarate aldolase
MSQDMHEVIRALAKLDTCTVANVIDDMDVRLRNQGFCDGSIHCMLPELPPVCGHAVTCTIRSAATPMEGRSYHDRTDWWAFIESQPRPRVIVLEDIDDRPGAGAFIGEIHGAILRALGCVACVTNGVVRNLPAAAREGLQLFASSVVVSHAFAHLTSFGKPAVIGGLEIKTGDLLHGDLHGVLKVPAQVAAEIPAQAARVLAERQKILDYCRSKQFSLEKLKQMMKQNWR